MWSHRQRTAPGRGDVAIVDESLARAISVVGPLARRVGWGRLIDHDVRLEDDAHLDLLDGGSPCRGECRVRVAQSGEERRGEHQHRTAMRGTGIPNGREAK